MKIALLVLAGLLITGPTLTWAQSSPAEALISPPAAVERGDSPASPETKAFARGVEAYRNRDFSAALETWTTLANGGHGPALYNLGVLFEHGRGVAPDYAQAATWYRKAAEHEMPQALNNLARLHAHGRGVAADEQKAAELYEAAARLGFAEAQFNLGVAYLMGRGVGKDAEEAAEWFTAAAEDGYGPAQFNLGELYLHGRGVEKDEDEAANWFAAAADNGDPVAHYVLGTLLMRDDSGAEGLAAGARHIRTAAEGGVMAAQNQLAILYAKGRGVRKDGEAALTWFTIAAGLGSPTAARNRALLEKQLDNATRKRARQRAAAFRPKSLTATN